MTEYYLAVLDQIRGLLKERNKLRKALAEIVRLADANAVRTGDLVVIRSDAIEAARAVLNEVDGG